MRKTTIYYKYITYKTTDHRATDRSSTDPPTTDPPTILELPHRLPTHRQVLYRPTDHLISKVVSNKEEDFGIILSVRS